MMHLPTQASSSTFLIMCNVPISHMIRNFLQMVYWMPAGIIARFFFFYPLVTIPVAPLITGTLHICRIFILKFLYDHHHHTLLLILMEHFLVSHTENQDF
jgi:hypothetical protein